MCVHVGTCFCKAILTVEVCLFKDEHNLANYSFDDNTKNGLSLSEHHTHFLLADDGRQNHAGCEFKLRMEVEYGLKNRERKKEGRLY